jgi:hypothetical protein
MNFKSTYLLNLTPKGLMSFAAAFVITLYVLEITQMSNRPLGDREADITVGLGPPANLSAYDTLTDDDRSVLDARPESFENRYAAGITLVETVGISTTVGLSEADICPARPTHQLFESADQVASTFAHIEIFCRSIASEKFGISFTSCASRPMPIANRPAGAQSARDGAAPVPTKCENVL